MAITKSTQAWTHGATVRVGFLTLRVVGVRAILDGKPDVYTLVSLDGTRSYTFTPHWGLERLA